MSFNPQTGLVYIPTMQLAVSIVKNAPQPGGFQVGPGQYAGRENRPRG